MHRTAGCHNGSVANDAVGWNRRSTGQTYAARLAKVWKGVVPFVGIWPLRIICAASMPAMVAAAEWNALKPIIGLVIRLMKRWSCSRMLFRYLTCRTSMTRPSPVNFSHKSVNSQLV